MESEKNEWGRMQEKMILLRLRDAIAQKEWITAQANSDLCRGGWMCDWEIPQQQAQAQIDQLIGMCQKPTATATTPDFDLVERLRFTYRASYEAPPILTEAADEIIRLRGLLKLATVVR